MRVTENGVILMNIVYLHTHDTGRYISPYGYASDTPNLMAFAKQSVLFANAHCANPTCSASRSALLTGTYPHTNGMLGLAHIGHKLKDYKMHLASFLQRNGYETALFGVQHEASGEIMRAEGYYNTYVNHPKVDDGNIFDTADTNNAESFAQYLKNYRSSHGTKPFFAVLGLSNTHREFVKDIENDYVRSIGNLHNNKATRRDSAGFYRSVKVADKCVGIALDAISAAGYTDDTIIIFTTDHGVAFPMMKCHLKDDGIGVSLIMKYPGCPEKTVTDALVSQVDVFPTICELAGLEKPEYLQGRSLLPVLNGEKDEVNDTIFAEINFHVAYEPVRAVKTKRFKLIKYFEEPSAVLCNTDDGFSKDFLTENGFYKHNQAAVQLYDLYLDPGEHVNLAEVPEYSSVKVDLLKTLGDWMTATSDPLLNGKIPTPEGVIDTPRSVVSPKEMRKYKGL